MSLRITWATAARVLHQLRRDHRTWRSSSIVPALLLTIVRFVFDGQPQTFDRVGPALVGIFPFVSMFLVTSIAMLRERTTGTLERLMSMPLAKIDLLAGYAIAFALMAVVQALITSAVAFWLLGLDVDGPGLARHRPRGRERAARHVARPLPLGLRADRVPGRAVHAGVRAAAVPALRPPRAARRS